MISLSMDFIDIAPVLLTFEHSSARELAPSIFVGSVMLPFDCLNILAHPGRYLLIALEIVLYCG